jgi:hypothetical protein
MSKNDSELLEQYAPVMRFSQGERFFPMRIEDYLSRSELYRSVQFGIYHLLGALILLSGIACVARQTLAVSPWWTILFGLLALSTPFGFRVRSWAKESDKSKALGRLRGPNYFLRFTKSIDYGTGCFFAILIPAVILFGILQGPVTAARVAIIGLLIFFVFSLLYKSDPIIYISTIIAWAVGAYFLFAFLYRYIGLWILCGIVFVAVVLILALLLVVLPRIGGLIALFSRTTDEVAERARDPNYKGILERYQASGANPYCYYGRVFEEENQAGKWTILQYNYFYAFNDWRLAAVGANNHEGDWEAVSIFLKDGNPKPEGVAFSQHHEGVYRNWDQVRKVVNPQEPYHPLVYVALGSHANYVTFNVSPFADMWQPTDPVQKIIIFLDSFLRSQVKDPGKQTRGLVTRITSNEPYPFQKKRSQERKKRDKEELQAKVDAVKAGMAHWGRMHPLDEAMEAGSTLPCEFHAGDGNRIGAPGDLMQEDIAFSGNLLTPERKKEVCQPQEYSWELQLIQRDSMPPWTEYQGLWGIKSLLSDESGPPGPKWDRISMKNAFLKYESKPRQRLRWEQPLHWLEHLQKTMQETEIKKTSQAAILTPGRRS